MVHGSAAFDQIQQVGQDAGQILLIQQLNLLASELYGEYA